MLLIRSCVIFIILLLWQFPQLMLGCIVRFAAGKRLIRRVGRVSVYSWSLRSGLSLGWFCFVPEGADERIIAHELGHTVQSTKLGPLYLLVIGLPSAVWALLYSLYSPEGNYCWFYTERWAEREGVRLSCLLAKSCAHEEDH